MPYTYGFLIKQQVLSALSMSEKLKLKKFNIKQHLKKW